ncbi:DUF4870 domain-containing protein [Candidatus Uhrbacteria bacterium]|nr:DUF4870 domain-containing protein [Candidatus Uhrbacteria bacterium]
MSQNVLQEAKPAPTKDKDIEDNKIIAAISYLGVLAFIPLLLKKDSPFAQHHARQGLALFMVWIAWGIVGLFFSLAQLSALVNLGYLTLIVIMIIGISKAWKGELWQLPIIGEYAKKLKF